MTKSLLLLAFTLMTNLAIAAPPETGKPAPALKIADKGELLLEQDEFSFRPWMSTTVSGKVHIIQYMAATMGASKLNEPFTDRLQLDIPDGNYHVTNVINLDDALWGTTGFVIKEVKSNKRKYPDSTMVLDKDGAGVKTWGLQEDSSAIIIIGVEGQVQMVREGAMTAEEIEAAISLVRRESTAVPS